MEYRTKCCWCDMAVIVTVEGGYIWDAEIACEPCYKDPHQVIQHNSGEWIEVTNVVQNNQMNSSTSSNPLYYRGFRALSSESETLKNRKSDDPFIEGLRDLQESLDTLRSIKIEDEGMHAVSIDQAAFPPKNRIKPDRRLIVSLGTVVGLFLGIFLVFFVSFIQKQKETHSE